MFMDGKKFCAVYQIAYLHQMKNVSLLLLYLMIFCFLDSYAHPEEYHTDTNVIAVWRHKTTGR